MGIYYYKLFDLLNRRGMKKGDLIMLAGISNTTMAKLSKHKVVQTDIIDRVCSALNCQPADIMEYIETKDTSIEENEK